MSVTGVGLFLNVSAFFMYHTIPVFLYKLPKSRGSGSKFPGGGQIFFIIFTISIYHTIPVFLYKLSGLKFPGDLFYNLYHFDSTIVQNLRISPIRSCKRKWYILVRIERESSTRAKHSLFLNKIFVKKENLYIYHIKSIPFLKRWKYSLQIMLLRLLQYQYHLFSKGKFTNVDGCHRFRYWIYQLFLRG